MTRQEHLDWCKKRALQYLYEFHEPSNAINSMLSDLNKHDETRNHVGSKLGVMLLINGYLKTNDDIKKWIEGFN